MKTFANLALSGQFMNVLTVKIFIEYDDVIILDKGDSILEIKDVASLSVARQHLSNRSFPNSHVDMVASINGRQFISCSLQFNLVRHFFPMHYSRCGYLPHPQTVVCHNSQNFKLRKFDFQQFQKSFTRERFPLYGNLFSTNQ